MARSTANVTPPVGQRHSGLPGWGLGVGLVSARNNSVVSKPRRRGSHRPKTSQRTYKKKKKKKKKKRKKRVYRQTMFGLLRETFQIHYD
jgi:hypothetical protein